MKIDILLEDSTILLICYW